MERWVEGDVTVGMWAAMRLEEVAGPGLADEGALGGALRKAVRWIGGGGGKEAAPKGGGEWEAVIGGLMGRDNLWQALIEEGVEGEFGEGVVKAIIAKGERTRGEELMGLGVGGRAKRELEAWLEGGGGSEVGMA